MAQLDRQGRVRLDLAGAVTGSHGLSVIPTRYELLFHEESGSSSASGQGRDAWTQWVA